MTDAADTHRPMEGALSFRRQPRSTGLAAIADPTPCVDVKIGGLVVGIIRPPSVRSDDRDWRVSFMTRCDAHPGWRWSRLTTRFSDETSARSWIQKQDAALRIKLDLHGHRP